MTSTTNQDTPVARQWRCVEDGEERTGWKDIDLGDLDGWARYADKHPGKVRIEYRDVFSSDQYDAVVEREAQAGAECERLRSWGLDIQRGYLVAIKALEFYANPEIYRPHPHGPAFDRRDLSFHARDALTKLQDTSHE